jgi:glucose-6-phosphate dehydrogenase assembly protein OpcA
MAATVHPDRILRDLSELWVSLGEQHGDESAGVLRACAMTLIVLAGAAEDESAVGETLASLMRDHPSRAIVVRVTDTAEPRLDARVFAQCWMPLGQRRQICCEQIEISASNGSLADVPAIVLPLVAADLPVIVWSRLPRLFPSPVLTDLSRFATKTILDSSAFPDPPAALQALAHAAAAGLLLADLAWTRLTRWRELIAQIFENPAYSSRILSIATVTIAYSSAVSQVSLDYMEAWLRLCLERAGAQPAFLREPSDEACSTGFCRIAFTSGVSGGLDIVVRKVEGSAVEVRAGTLVNRTVFPQVSDYALLREELSITGHDPIYEAVLGRAAEAGMKQ